MSDDQYGLPLPVDGDSEEAMRNRVAASSLLRAAGIKGCDCAGPCDCLVVAGLWVDPVDGITVRTEDSLIRLSVVFRDGQRDGKPDSAKGADVADQPKAEGSPGERIYRALEHIAKTLGKNAGDLHADVMPLVRQYDDGLERTWRLVNDGAAKGAVLDALEANLPQFRRDELPARKA